MALLMSRAQTTPVMFSPIRPRVTFAAPAVARLNSGASRSVTTPVRQVSISSRPSGRSAVTVTRAAGLTYEFNPESKGDYAPILGIAGLVAWTYGKVSLNAPLLLKAIAFYQLIVAVVAVVTRKGETDHIASVVAPAVLAVYVLNFNQFSYMDGAIAAFGYFLAQQLEGVTLIWLATLAGAMYAGYPSHWFVGAAALLAASRLVRGGQNNVVPVYTIPTVAAAAYAFYKDVTPQFTVALIIGQVLASLLKYVEGVVDS